MNLYPSEIFLDRKADFQLTIENEVVAKDYGHG